MFSFTGLSEVRACVMIRVYLAGVAVLIFGGV